MMRTLETWLDDGEFALGTNTFTIADAHMMCMFEQLSVSYEWFDKNVTKNNKLGPYWARLKATQTFEKFEIANIGLL